MYSFVSMEPKSLRLDFTFVNKGEPMKPRFPFSTACLLLVSFTFSIVGQAGGEALQKVTPPALQPHHPRYQLRIGDTFDISFRFTPEFDQTVTIQPDGYINLRDVPDIFVAGKTSPEVIELIRKAYSGMLHDPVVTLMLKDFEKPYFVAGGELGNPGKYDLRGTTTVLQAIQIAGGFLPSAKHSQVLVFHRVSDEWTAVKKLDVKAMLHSGSLEEDPALHPGDMIYVPKNALSKIMPFIPNSSIRVFPPTR